ncbi:MAG: nitrilase-related carbon-nitrogen hydrolase, partial [Myxococcota bacterium]
TTSTTPATSSSSITTRFSTRRPTCTTKPSPAGSGDGLSFWGGSFIADPFGRVLAEAPHDEEAILVVECDPAAAEEVRRHWPFLRDRRIDAYDGITRRLLDK